MPRRRRVNHGLVGAENRDEVAVADDLDGPFTGTADRVLVDGRYSATTAGWRTTRAYTMPSTFTSWMKIGAPNHFVREVERASALADNAVIVRRFDGEAGPSRTESGRRYWRATSNPGRSSCHHGKPRRPSWRDLVAAQFSW